MSEEGTQLGAQQPQNVVVDEIRLKQYIQELRDNQSMGIGLLTGLITALVGAAIWATITYFTQYQIGWMAIGVGVLVGLVIRKTAKGVDTSFGIMGGLLSLLGCIIGNLLVIAVFLAEDEGIAVTTVLSELTPALAVDILIKTFHPMDILIYGFAVYYGFKYSIYKLSQQEINNFTRPA